MVIHNLVIYEPETRIFHIMFQNGKIIGFTLNEPYYNKEPPVKKFLSIITEQVNNFWR